jgi:hypothetical protein
LLNEYFLVIRQVFKVDLEDHFVVHVDDCGPTGHAKSVSTVKSDILSPAHEASREKPRGEDLELSPNLKGDTEPDGRDLGHASQFDRAIDKERKLISNLR